MDDWCGDLPASGVRPATQASCDFECKTYPNGDKFCWEWLRGKPKMSMVDCEVVSFCYIGIDGTTWCEIRCQGTKCYLA